MTGFWNSEATSRKIWMLSASRSSRWLRRGVGAGSAKVVIVFGAGQKKTHDPSGRWAVFLTESVEIRSYLLELTPTLPCAAATRHTTGVATGAAYGMEGMNHCYKGD